MSVRIPLSVFQEQIRTPPSPAPRSPPSTRVSNVKKRRFALCGGGGGGGGGQRIPLAQLTSRKRGRRALQVARRRIFAVRLKTRARAAAGPAKRRRLQSRAEPLATRTIAPAHAGERGLPQSEYAPTRYPVPKPAPPPLLLTRAPHRALRRGGKGRTGVLICCWYACLLNLAIRCQGVSLLPYLNKS